MIRVRLASLSAATVFTAWCAADPAAVYVSARLRRPGPVDQTSATRSSVADMTGSHPILPEAPSHPAAAAARLSQLYMA
jgi:hypothetical protein